MKTACSIDVARCFFFTKNAKLGTLLIKNGPTTLRAYKRVFIFLIKSGPTN